MDKQITSLLNFIDNSPCNFYAVNTAKKMLEENGFTEKLLGNEIEAKPGEKFYFTKNDSAIFAFLVRPSTLVGRPCAAQRRRRYAPHYPIGEN